MRTSTIARSDRARRRRRGATRRRRPGRRRSARRPRGDRRGPHGEGPCPRRSRSAWDRHLTRVPLPRGLTISNVPPCAATRSRRPARPDPRRTTAPPTPSSATVTCSVPLSWTARTVTLDGDPCLTAFVRASHATKYAAASTLAGARSPLASTSTGTGEVLARSRKAAASPSSSRAGRTPAAI